MTINLSGKSVLGVNSKLKLTRTYINKKIVPLFPHTNLTIVNEIEAHRYAINKLMVIELLHIDNNITTQAVAYKGKHSIPTTVFNRIRPSLYTRQRDDMKPLETDQFLNKQIDVYIDATTAKVIDETQFLVLNKQPFSQIFKKDYLKGNNYILSKGEIDSLLSEIIDQQKIKSRKNHK